VNPIEELAGKLGDQLLTVEEVLKLPAPEWLVEDLLPKDALGVLFGAPGSYKSFLALDWALCVAAGLSWGHHEVRKGPAIYISGEGRSGFSIRLEAWLSNAGLETVEGFHLFPNALPLLDQERMVAAFVKLVQVIRPSIVVIDTLARSMAGGDENSTRDMGTLMDSVDRIRAASEAHVLMVHHTTKGTASMYRGNSALEGAADTMVNVDVEEASREVTLSCFKQKEDSPFQDLHLHPKEVTVRGGTTTSCVLFFSGAREKKRLRSVHESAVLSALLSTPTGTAFSPRQVMEVAGLAMATTYRTLKSLVEQGYILQLGEGRGQRFTLNPAHSEEFFSSLLNSSHESGASHPSSHHAGGSIEPPGEKKEPERKAEEGQATLECTEDPEGEDHG
jgi:hypothetical protein